MLDDPWIREHSFLSPEKTHALGFLSIIWTSCEARTQEVFKFVAGLPTPVARIITHDLGDVTIWTKIVQIAGERALDVEFIEHLKHASRFHEICRANRNQYVHISLQGGDIFNGEDPFRLARDKGHKQEIHKLNDSVEEIRRVCADAMRLMRYCGGLMLTAAFHSRPRPGQKPLAWPDKPTLPELVWKPLPQKPPRQPRQPKPSPPKPARAR